MQSTPSTRNRTCPLLNVQLPIGSRAEGTIPLEEEDKYPTRMPHLCVHGRCSHRRARSSQQVLIGWKSHQTPPAGRVNRSYSI